VAMDIPVVREVVGRVCRPATGTFLAGTSRAAGVVSFAVRRRHAA
jgi:hypothetical protein